MTKAQRDYKKAMVAWAKAVIEWQLANPEKDWLQEMRTADLDDNEGGGSNPKPPPPPPPFP